MKKMTLEKCLVGATFLAVCLLAPLRAWPQDASPKLGSDDTTQTGTTESDSPIGAGSGQAAPIAPYQPGGFFVRALGEADPLRDGGILAWGPVSIPSAQFSQVYGSTTFDDGTAGPPENGSGTLSIFTTTVVYDKALDNYRLAIQYMPSMFIDGGNVSYDMNQQAEVSTGFKLSDRWTLAVGDDLLYLASQRVVTELGLNVDFQSGSTVQNNFLDGPGTVFSNDAHGMFSYAWTPRTSVSFGPTYVYERSTGALASGAEATGTYTGGEVSLSHSLSPLSSVIFNYQAEHSSFSNNAALEGGPAPGSAFLQDFTAGYYRQLSETWRFNAAVGVYTGSGDVSNATGLDVLAGVNKSYRRAEIGLDFDQGRSFNGFITNQATDRTDLLVRVHWTPRFITDSSASYFTTVGGPTVSGTYETIQMGYVLTPHVSLIADGSYVQQRGNNVFVLGSRQYLGSVGIRWDSAPSPIY